MLRGDLHGTARFLAALAHHTPSHRHALFHCYQRTGSISLGFVVRCLRFMSYGIVRLIVTSISQRVYSLLHNTIQ